MTIGGSPVRQAYAMCVVRIMMGVVLLAHGYSLARAGLAEASRGLAMLGFPESEALAAFAIIASFVAGLGLIVGLFTRWAALVMGAYFGLIALFAILGRGLYGAILYLPRAGGFLPVSLLEFLLALVAIDLCLTIGGPSAFSIDGALRESACRYDRRLALAVAAVRSVVGSIFLLHGLQKLAGYGLQSVAEELAKLQFPEPRISALTVVVVELLCGALLLCGLFARFAAAMLAVEMTVAVIFVHLRQGFFAGFFWPGGYEYALTLLAMNVSLILGGAGAFALNGARRQGAGQGSAPQGAAT